MLEIHLNVTVSCPDLVAAAKLLKGAAPEANPAAPVTAAPIQQPLVAPAPVPTQQAPQLQPPVTAPAPAAPAAPAVPLAQAPTFTQADIAKAGADLFTSRPDLQPQVLALLAQYGCQSVMDLKPEQFGPFATALRGMGAKI